jgi:acyl transferase domain-containing protein/acyl carrier protein
LLGYILDAIARSLDVGRDQLDPDQRFADLSADSLKAVELKDHFEDQLGLKLRSTLLFDHPTPTALCDHLAAQLERSQPAVGRQAAGAARSATAPTPPVAAGGAGGDDDLIAIVGAACRLPGGCDSPEAFWTLLREGRDAIVTLTPKTLGPRADLADVLGEVPPFAGLISAPAEFDARLFGVSPKEALDMDPQQRVLLQVCWEALENAAVPPRSARSRGTAVFVGTRGSEYHDGRRAGGDPAYQGTGASVAALAGRVAHCFGFTGAAVTLDTACSASLVALHYAAEELRRGDCTLAVAAGVNLLISPLAMRATHAARMLAPDGRCKTFSNEANGYVRSEGCVAVVLRRLADARANGEPVLGIVRGSAVNQDGTTSGLTVPSARAQQEVIRRALERARVDAQAVGYVECHGTGTELGDPIELQALSEALEAGKRARPLPIGSVKSQIGHTEPTAGLAGVLKVLLAMRHGELPRTLHCSGEAGLNPHVDWQALGLRPALTTAPFPRADGSLFAGISSFGFTGTNAHVLLSTPPSVPSVAERPFDPWPVLTLSANTPDALEALADRWARWLDGRSDAEIDLACRWSNTSRAGLPYRRVWHTTRLADLPGAIAGRDRAAVARTGGGRPATAVALLGDAAAWRGYEEAFAGWVAFARALSVRLEAVSATIGAPLGAEGAGPELRALAVACAVGDGLIALGLQPELWIGDGIGGAAAHVLGGAPLERVVAIVAAGGSLGHLRTPSVHSYSEGIELIGAVRVVGVSPTAELPGGLRLEPSAASLTALCAALYKDGVDVDWAGARPPRSPLLLDLPNYPFEAQSYWLPLDQPGAGAGRSGAGPVLEELRTPGLLSGARSFRIDLDPERHPWVRDHAVEATPILPAAGVLAILRAVGERLLEGQPVGVYDLELERPIVLRDGAGEVHVVSFPDLSGDGFSIEVSCPRRGEFVRHARARVAAGALAPREGAGPIAWPAGVDTAELVAGDLYAMLHQAGIDHGPQFRALTRVRYTAEEAAVEARVAASADLAWATVGLDACFITSAVLLRERGDLTARIPVGVDEVTFFGPPPREVTASVRLRPDAGSRDARADVELWDLQGCAVARVRGLRLGARDRGGSRAAGARPFRIDWSERALPLAPRADVPWKFDIVSDDPAFAERLCSVLAAVHGASASARSLAAGDDARGGAPAPGPRQVVWINRRLSGPEFLHALLPELRSLVEETPGAQLWCVTHGVHTAAAAPSSPPEAFDALSRAVLWGLGRSIQQEQPRLRCTLVDLDAELSAEAECELLAAEFRRNADDPQVRYAVGVRQVAALVEEAPAEVTGGRPLTLRQDGSYLVTGATGGLGQLAVEQLAAAGAGHVIVASRSATGVQDLARRLEAYDTRLTVWQLDVADRDALAGALEGIRHSGPPLRGVIHAAGIIKDHTLGQLDAADLSAVFGPKVAGAWNLHALTAHDQLDFFVLYSSLAGVLGSPGQANYAAANAFLDALVDARNRAGLVGASLGWGPWGEVGMAAGREGGAARLARLGIGPLSNADGLAFLSAALAGTRGAVAVAPVEWHTYAANVDPRLHSVLPLGTLADANSGVGELGAELRSLVGAQPEEAARRLDEYLQRRVLEVAGSRVISERDSFFELGLDSLQAVAMRNRLERDLGIELGPSLIFDYPTLADLRAHLVHDHLGVARSGAAVSSRAEPSPSGSEADPTVAPSDQPGSADPPADDELLAKLEADLRLLEQELDA